MEEVTEVVTEVVPVVVVDRPVTHAADMATCLETVRKVKNATIVRTLPLAHG